MRGPSCHYLTPCASAAGACGAAARPRSRAYLARLRRANAPVSSKRGLGSEPELARRTEAVGGRVVARAGSRPATCLPRPRRVTCERSSARSRGEGPPRPPSAKRPAPEPARGGTAEPTAAIRRGPRPSAEVRSGARTPRNARRSRGTPMAAARAGGSPGGGARGAEPTKSLASGIEEYTEACGGIGRGYLTPCASAAGACGGPRRPGKHTRRRAAAPRPPAAASAC